MLQSLFYSLQHNSWVVAVNSSGWMSAILEVTHYFSFFLLVGSIAIVDLRIIGVAGRRQSARQLAEQVFPWIWTGLGLAVLSGFIMFAGDATEYLHIGCKPIRPYIARVTETQGRQAIQCVGAAQERVSTLSSLSQRSHDRSAYTPRVINGSDAGRLLYSVF